MELRIREEAAEAREHALQDREQAALELKEQLELQARQLAERAQAIANNKQADLGASQRLREVKAAEERLREAERRLAEWQVALDARAAEVHALELAAMRHAEELQAQVAPAPRFERASSPPESNDLLLDPPNSGTGLQLRPPAGAPPVPTLVTQPVAAREAGRSLAPFQRAREHALESDPQHLHLVREVALLRKGQIEMQEMLHALSMQLYELGVHAEEAHASQPAEPAEDRSTPVAGTIPQENPDSLSIRRLKNL